MNLDEINEKNMARINPELKKKNSSQTDHVFFQFLLFRKYFLVFFLVKFFSIYHKQLTRKQQNFNDLKMRNVNGN